MNIVRLNGEDEELFQRVARLVMNKEVLASNNNYPFKTSPDHIWFVAYDDDNRTVGFVPVAIKNKKGTINNYYAADDNAEILCLLLKRTTEELQHDFTIIAVTQRHHFQIFRECGFKTMFEWEKYVKMIYDAEDKEERL